MKKILVRSLSGAIFVAIIVVSIYLGQWIGNRAVGDIVFAVVMSTVGIIGIHEAVSNLHKSGRHVNRALSYIMAAVVFAIFIAMYIFVIIDNTCYDDVHLRSDPYDGTMISMVLSAIFFFLAPTITLIIELFRDEKEPFASVGHTLTSTVWVVIPMISLMAIHSDNHRMLMLLFILVWVNDTFAYLTGMLLGRHKLWERHSPNKTWEGTIGGVVFCMAAAVILGPMLVGATFMPNDWPLLAAIGLMTGTVGTLGDLVESMFKRSCGIKDSGNIMPGHGGILDRFDSILATAPFMLIIVILM